MASTNKPTGLAIERKDLTFTLKWKIADKDYGNGQQMQYAVFTTQQIFKAALGILSSGQTSGETSIAGTIWPSIANQVKWNDVSIGKTTTSKSISLSAGSYYPTSKKPYLQGLIFRVRGNRKQYTEKEKYKDKKGKTKYRDVKINPGWSAWSYASFDVKAPAPPKVWTTWDETYDNRSTLHWDCGAKEAKSAPWTRVVIETISKKNYNGEVNKMPGWKNATRTTSSSRASTTYHDESALDDNSLTRGWRVKSVGPAGDSDWRYTKHVFARPNAARNVTVETTRNDATNSYHFIISWDAPATTARPIDSTTAEWMIAEPDTGLTPPSSGQWNPFPVTKDTTATNRFSYDLQQTVGPDECLWIQVVTKHDNDEYYSEPVLAVIGRLKKPTISSIATDSGTHKATLTISDVSQVADAFHVITYEPEGGSDDPYAGKIIGVMNAGVTTLQVQCPTWTATPAFGVHAVVGSVDSSYTDDNSVKIYTVTEDMTSETSYTTGNVPKAPTNVAAEQLGTAATIRVTWQVPWDDATGAEVSWADHDDAWHSTEQPQTFDVENLKESLLHITGLELGKTWYVRVRLYKTNTSGTDIFGPYSDIIPVDLSTTPAVPDLQITDEDGIIAADGSTVATWVYVSSDGTRQASAVIAEVTEDSGGDYQYDPLVQVSTQQQAQLNAEDLGWLNGTQHMIAVQVTSESGKPSRWSEPVTITIADAITCSMTLGANFTTDTIDGISQNVLEALPVNLTITGAGTGGETTCIIERAESYDLDRPDERVYNAFQGAAVAQVEQPGDAAIEINLEDLLGRLDDGVHYTIKASVRDSAGQTAETSEDFIVRWSKQAHIPGGTVTLEDGIAKITPTAPALANVDDTVDIYRLSADKPELLVHDGSFGTTYVDPYPTLNEFGGYRIVTVTAYGDYIDPDNHLAWTDIRADNESLEQYIDFNGNKLPLKFNANLSGSWTKQFTKTQYLGGSTQGDWLDGVAYEGQTDGIIIRDIEFDQYMTLRELARWSGICHVRTTDGGNYTANVNVSFSAEHGQPEHPLTATLTIVKVDNPRTDGQTLAEWETSESS